MKQGWEIKKLGEVCEILNGYAFKSEKYNSEGVRVLRITNVQKGYVVDDDPKFYPKDEMANLQQYILKENDLLMSLTGNVGRVGLLQNEMLPAALNQRVACLRIKNEQLYINYLFHFLNSDKFENDAIFSASGIAQKNMSTEWLKKYTIPVPHREEQERIVAELDCLSGVIEKKREQLRELDALAQSIFYQMFGDPITNEKGWEVKKVKDIFSVKIGPFGSLLHNSDYISGGTPLVNPIHMHNERICPDYDFSVSDNKLKELGNYILHTDDIVLARRGDIGRCAIVGMNEDGYLCGTGSLFIRPITNINSNFIIKQIRCNTMIEHLTSLAKGATMLNINCKIVEELIVILPPLTLQQEFAEKIEAIEKQKELIKQSISKTEELFNSRMDYYFN